MLMHKSIFVAMAIAMVCLLGCNSGSESGSGDDPLTIAVIPKQTGGEFWETVESGARDAAHALGVQVKWEGTLTETEIAEQNRIIENMINLGVDGMAVAPLNAKATRKSVAGAVDALVKAQTILDPAPTVSSAPMTLPSSTIGLWANGIPDESSHTTERSSQFTRSNSTMRYVPGSTTCDPSRPFRAVITPEASPLSEKENVSNDEMGTPSVSVVVFSTVMRA